MASIPPYSALLPTILCQQPAVILHWLQTERATGNLPVEVALDCIVELLSRQSATQPDPSKVINRQFAQLLDAETSVKELTQERDKLTDQLEVYKRAIQACRVFVPIRLADHEDGRPRYQGEERKAAYEALDAVDKLEGK